MSKKIWIFLLALCLVCVSACALADTACEHKYDYKEQVTNYGDPCKVKDVFKSYCVLCGDVKYFSDYAHENKKFTVVDATCTEPAKVGYVCVKENGIGCGKTIGEMVVVPGSVPADHKLVNLTDAADTAWANTYGKAYKEATCAKEGVAFKACSVCTKYDANGYYKSGYEPVLTTLAKAKHTFNNNEVEKCGPTCVDDEYFGQKCDNYADCKYIKYVAPVLDGKKATGHNYYLFTKDATCVADGYSVMKCAACDYEDAATKKVIALDSTAHTIKVVSIVRPAECAASGYQMGVVKIKCELCEKDLGYKTEEPTHNGPMTPSSDYKPATCATAAQGKQTCGTCGAVVKATAPATGKHVYVENLYAPANCKEAARYGTLCGVCYAAKPGTTVTYVEGSTPADHDWNYSKVYSEATCKTEGKAWATTCKNCGEAKNGLVVTPKKAHTFVPGQEWDEKLPANCIEPERRVIYCDVCEEVAKSEAIVGSKPNGHSFTKDVKKDPTCQEAGYTVKKCANCDAVDEATRVIKPAVPTKHTYAGEEEIVAADCSKEQNAVIKAYCSVEGCGWVGYYAKAYEHVPMAGSPAKPTANCKEDQKWQYTCDVCGKAQTEIVKKSDNHIGTIIKNHQFDATCTEPAYTGTYCTFCKANVNGDKVVVAGSTPKRHNYVEVKYPEPTCVDYGYIYSTCSNCGDQKPVVLVDKLPHNFGEEPVYKTEGDVLYKKCVNACHTETDCWIKVSEIEEKPTECKHILVAVAGKAPTCSVPGLTEGQKCVVCNKMIVKQEVIPTIDHTVVQLEGSYAATCTKAGWSAGKICTVCNTMVEAEKELPALGHKYNEDGICTVCGEKDPNFAENHDHVYTKSYSFNDDFTKRVVTYTCTKCDHTYSEEEDF